MLAMVKRVSVEKAATPAPRYSTVRSMAAVLRPSTRSVSRMMSLPAMPNPGTPRYSTAMASGTSIHDCPSTMAAVTSAPPSPIAKAPRPPCDDVWESAPRTTSPGRTRSR